MVIFKALMVCVSVIWTVFALASTASAHTGVDQLIQPETGPVYAVAMALLVVLALRLRIKRFPYAALLREIGSTVRHHSTVFIVSAIGMTAFYTSTTALNWYSYIPDWVPYGFAFWTPDDPNFESYLISFRLNENWQINFNDLHLAHLLAIVPLFAISMAFLAQFSRKSQVNGNNKTGVLSADVTAAVSAGGVTVSVFTSFSCCFPAFALYLLPTVVTSSYFALSAFENTIGTLALVGMFFNIGILAEKSYLKIQTCGKHSRKSH